MRVAKPDAIGLILEIAAIAVHPGREAERGAELRGRSQSVVVDRFGREQRRQAAELSPHVLSHLPARVLVRVMRQLVADDDGQLVVGHVVHDAAEDPDGAVAHRHRVPLFVVDDIDANLRLIDIRRRHAPHQATDAIDRRPSRGNFADDLAFVPPASTSKASPLRSHRPSSSSVPFCTSLSKSASPLGRTSISRARTMPSGWRDAAHADFVAERNVVDRRGLALPTRALIRAHALAIDHDQPGASPLGVAVQSNRVLCSADRQSSGEPNEQHAGREDRQTAIAR